ncbi:PIG-L family deacetylase [Geomonas oryzisoli]|uniref:PIG-L family deacetylase n=1 Tax=Geomonas oryzisoli TaxID=2847992 RepID=A0ABX8J4T3_9BACT|nr:PIG-L deacetylase family protein [Geomonas oryzisoli]QWV91957.1 PIG-L family deacetylase [Geomonas oryzisoli]
MIRSFKRILVLAPHTDDGEFGCGGTLTRFIDEQKEVFYAAFSDCEKSLPPGCPSGTLARELGEATSLLKIPAANVFNLGFEVRCFPRDRQEILDSMVKLGKDIRPDLVFLPSSQDLHQDHGTIASEGLRAFKLSSTILGYEVPWNNLSFNTTCFVTLTEDHLKTKIAALACYRSQNQRFYSSEEFLRSLAITRGTQVGVKYAETFEVLRWIM